MVLTGGKSYGKSLQIGRNDVTYLWSQYDRHFVGQSPSYCA